ncbi:MAG: hypothetical protein QM734_10400 [Cyclobacteriaceae bacterium]
MNATTTDINQVKPDSTVLTHMSIYEKNLWQSATGALSLQSKLNDKNQISINADYLYYHDDNPSRYNNNVQYVENNTQDVSLINLSKAHSNKNVRW